MLHPASLWYKLHKISQAHLAPGMSLAKLNAILADYIHPSTRNLDALTPPQIDEIIQRISAEVARAKEAA